MNIPVYRVLVLLLLLSLAIADQGDAQNRRRRARQAIFSNQTQHDTSDERPSLGDECSTPGRPKPEVEVGSNSSPVLCGKAISLPKPAYPEQAKAQKVSGVVRVNIVIDENGKVIWAEAVEGHPLLREASVRAACLSRHSPVKISNRPVKAGSVVTYYFVAQ